MSELEQILSRNNSVGRLVDVYDIGTIALYTPPPREFNFSMMNTSSHLPLERQSTLFDYGIGSGYLKKEEPIIIPPIKMPDLIIPDLTPKMGLMNEEKFQYGYDLPATQTQFHFHGKDKDHLSYGKLIDYNRNRLFEEKNSFNLAMNDHFFDKTGFKKFP